MKVLVTNIKIENYDTKLPVIFNSPPLAQVFLRGELFYSRDIAYDVEKMLNDDRFYESTAMLGDSSTEWSCDINDAQYDENITVSVIPMHVATALCYISTDELKYADGDLQQAVFEKLLHHLDVRFLYKPI